MNTKSYRMVWLMVACLLSFFMACGDDDDSSTGSGQTDDDNDHDAADDDHAAVDDDDDDNAAVDDDDDDNDAVDDDDDATDDDNNAVDDDDDDNDLADDDDSEADVWADPSSGLMWQNGREVGQVGRPWRLANRYCRYLTWGGYSDWRLPTIDELRSLIRGCGATAPGGACGVTDACRADDCWNESCVGCDFLEGPGVDGVYWPAGVTGYYSWYTNYPYWSSSLVVGYSDVAWQVFFEDAGIYSSAGYVAMRCVRSLSD